MIEILPMKPEHVPQIAALERQCFSDPWSENSISSELDSDLSLWLVALDGEQVAGYIGAQSVPPEADVMNLAVSPQYRRSGIGQRLLETLINRLAAEGINSLALEVRPSNEAALTLYRRFGFREIGRRPRYYVNPVEDALILQKELFHADPVNLIFLRRNSCSPCSRWARSLYGLHCFPGGAS